MRESVQQTIDKKDEIEVTTAPYQELKLYASALNTLGNHVKSPNHVSLNMQYRRLLDDMYWGGRTIESIQAMRIIVLELEKDVWSRVEEMQNIDAIT